MLGSLGFALAGCAQDEPVGRLGQLQTLRFEYAGQDCGSRCSIDREVLVGSSVGVDVYNLHRVAFQVRSTRPAVATFEAVPRCRHLASENCHEQVQLVTHSAGDADLEIFDEWTGTVLDRITLHVREAAVLDTTVHAVQDGRPVDLPATDGTFELKVASELEIATIARGTSGEELLASPHAIRGTYHDTRILGPCRAAGCVVTDVVSEHRAREQARANAAGITTVSVESGNVRHDLPFRVVE